MANEATKLTIGGVEHDIMDAEARRLIALLQSALDAMTGSDTTTAIKTFQEVLDFLAGVTDDETLVGKITALQTAINGKVDKEQGKGLSSNDYTTAEKQKLAGLSNYNDSALQTAVNNLQTALANVYTKAQTDNAIQEAVEGLGGAVSVTTNEDGTFTIHVGETDYTINLNHTHENMAKIVKCTESTLPQTFKNDTIYVQVNDASNPTEIERLYMFGLEFTGGSSAPGVPTLTSPSNGSAINVGTNTGSGVTKTLRVKGRNLTQALTVAISGTGFSVDVNSISAADANLGIDIAITYNGTHADASGTLLISSSSEVSVQCDVSASYENPYETMGVQFDKAIDNNIQGDGIRTAAGYCISPVLSVKRNHEYKVCFGFKGSGTTATYGMGVYDNNNWKLATFTADSADSDGVREISMTYAAVTALCTFLSSKIDDCYVFDKTTGEYLFKGLNVQ